MLCTRFGMEIFMRSNFKIRRRPEPDGSLLTYEESLRKDLKLAAWELENAYAGFDYVTDPDLIDCYIFELNAAMKRYKYLSEKFASLRKTTLDTHGAVDLPGTPDQADPSPEAILQPLL